LTLDTSPSSRSSKFFSIDVPWLAVTDKRLRGRSSIVLAIKAFVYFRYDGEGSIRIYYPFDSTQRLIDKKCLVSTKVAE